jgi:hypothetical protein
VSVSGSLTVCLPETSETGEQERSDRHRLDMLAWVPDGARVTIDIGTRRYVSRDAASILNQHSERLDLCIDGADPQTVHGFVRAARQGSLVGGWS